MGYIINIIWHYKVLSRIFVRYLIISRIPWTKLVATPQATLLGTMSEWKSLNFDKVNDLVKIKTSSFQKCSIWLLFYGVLLTTLLWRCISWVLVRIDLNLLRPRQNGLHFADDIFKCIFFNENLGILIKISLKFVPAGPMNNLITLVWMMTLSRKAKSHYLKQWWHSLQIHICVTRPQWVKYTDKNTSQWKCPGWDCCICCVIKCIFVCCCFSFLLHDLQ